MGRASLRGQQSEPVLGDVPAQQIAKPLAMWSRRTLEEEEASAARETSPAFTGGVVRSEKGSGRSSSSLVVPVQGSQYKCSFHPVGRQERGQKTTCDG